MAGQESFPPLVYLYDIIAVLTRGVIISDSLGGQRPDPTQQQRASICVAVYALRRSAAFLCRREARESTHFSLQ